MTEQEQRAAVLQAAQSWLGTPYHHMGRVKGAGCDCVTFLAQVFEEAGLVPHVPIDPYPHDWHLHKSIERYIDGLKQYVREIQPPAQPGDIALFRFGRAFSHGAIVVKWPIVIHSRVLRGVEFASVEDGDLVGRPTQLFSYWGEST